MPGIKLEHLPKLKILNLESNAIQKVTEDDLRPLSKSAELISLSMADNRIHKIDCGVFAYTSNLRVLSLQGNKLESLSCQPKSENTCRIYFITISIILFILFKI